MKTLFTQVFSFLIGGTRVQFAADAPAAKAELAKPLPPKAKGAFRVVAYNVEFGRSARAEAFAQMALACEADLAAFSEAPGGDWTRTVGHASRLTNTKAGEISSARHKDKYKSLVCRLPLDKTWETPLEGKGWNPASAVGGLVEIGGRKVAFLSLHVSGGGKDTGRDPAGTHSDALIKKLLAEPAGDATVVMGDFNDLPTSRTMGLWRKAGFASVWEATKINTSTLYTWNAMTDEHQGVIDHILVTPAARIRIVQGGILELAKPISDHKPVWADLEIR